MVSKRMPILVLLLALSLIAYAQDTSSDQGMEGAQGGSLEPISNGLYRVSDGLNVAIRNGSGDVSGQVSDIILNRNGEMRFLVASISQGAPAGGMEEDSAAGAEGSAYLIPIERASFDAAAGEFRFDLNAEDLNRLMRLENGGVPAALNAPGSGTAPSTATIPDDVDPTGTIAEYGSEPRSSTAPPVATIPDDVEPTGTARRGTGLSNRHVLLSSLFGSEFTNLQAEDLGRIEDVVLNISQSRVEYLAASTTGGLGLGDRYFAIPMRTFIEVNPREQRVVLDVHQENFRGESGFPANGAWPREGDASFGSVGDPTDVLNTGPK